MLKKISKKEIDALFSYEPIESEFRTRAYKKWRNLNEDVSIYSKSRKRIELDASILTQTKYCNRG